MCSFSSTSVSNTYMLDVTLLPFNVHASVVNRYSRSACITFEHPCQAYVTSIADCYGTIRFYLPDFDLSVIQGPAGHG